MADGDHVVLQPSLLVYIVHRFSRPTYPHRACQDFTFGDPATWLTTVSRRFLGYSDENTLTFRDKMHKVPPKPSQPSVESEQSGFHIRKYHCVGNCVS